MIMAAIKEISLDDALPGMTLAEAVVDKSGARLISPRVELTEKSIHALKQRGIHRVNIVMPITDEAQSLLLEKMMQRLETLFKNSLDNEPNRYLLECLRRYRTRKMK